MRLLGEGDLPLLLRPADDLFDNPVDEGLASSFLDDPRHHMVGAIEDGVLIGFASALDYFHPDKPRQLWISEVSVAPAHRRRGIGKAVMAEMLRHAHAMDCREVSLATEPENEPAHALYLRCGGRAETVVMYEFDMGET